MNFTDPSPMRVAMMQVNNPPPNILTINPSLPVGIDSIIQKALAKKPEHRFGTASQLVTALTEAAQGIPSRRARKRWMKDELDKKLEELENE